MKKHNELKAGLFVCTGIVIFALSIFVLGKERQIFASQEPFYAVFKDIMGLAKGAPVRLGGIGIGRVEGVAFSEDASDPRVRVTLLVNEGYLDRIRDDSVVSIDTQGLLGDRFINISMGAGKPLPYGSTLPTLEAPDMAQMLARATAVVDSTAQIAQKVNTILDGFGPEVAKSMGDGAKSLSALVNEIQEGEGLIHRLIYSKDEGEDIIASIAKASKDISSITEQMKSGEGILHALLYEPTGKDTVVALTDAAKRIADTAAHISDLAAQVKTGEGLAHELVYNRPEKGITDIMRELSATTSNLKQASEALAKGSGTIGALLVDSQLYDNLVEVTDGAKRSFILRQAIRSSMKN